jgi:hypothetical protein
MWCAWKRGEPKLFEKLIVFLSCAGNRFFNLDQFFVRLSEVNLLLGGGGADVARDVQVEVVLLDLIHLDPAGVAGLLLSELVGVDDPGDVLRAQLVLALAFHEMLSGVDEEYVVGLLALLEHEDADRDAGGVEEIRRQADDGVDVAVLEQLGADAFSAPPRKSTPCGRMIAITPSSLR